MRVKRKILFLTVILLIVSALLFPQKTFAACALIVSVNDYEAEYVACTGNLIQGNSNIAGFTYDGTSNGIILDGFDGTIGFICSGSCGAKYVGPTPPSIKVIGESTVNGILIQPGKKAIVLELKITDSGFDFGGPETILSINVLDEGEVEETEAEANTEKTEIIPIADAQETLCTKESAFSHKNFILCLCISFASIQLLLIVGYIVYRTTKKAKHKDISSPDAGASGMGFPDQQY